MPEAFPLPDPITPEWLTKVLSLSGMLGTGAVTTVEQQPTAAFNSATSRLTLRFTDDVPASVPTHLILKSNIAEEWAREAGAEEVGFYTLVAALADHPRVIAPCYGAVHDESSGQSYLLLRDLSATHRPPVTREQLIGLVEAVPSDSAIAAVVETLADLHAYWWDNPLLHAGQFPVGYWSRTAERFQAYLEKRTNSWQHLIAREKSRLPEDVRALYQKVLACLPSYWERWLYPRFQASRHLTLVHGDAYFANFLCPQPPNGGPTYLLDWQSPGVDVGAYDLANLCATFWTSAERHENQREEQILRRYHDTLRAHGVSGYQWEDLLGDYQLGLIFWLLMPVQDAADGSSYDYWWPKMQCLVAAFRDWRCEERL
jgi:thiamine kinase-like enzyme